MRALLFEDSRMNIPLVKKDINNEEICLVDNAITHTIFKDKKYFSYLVM